MRFAPLAIALTVVACDQAKVEKVGGDGGRAPGRGDGGGGAEPGFVFLRPEAGALPPAPDGGEPTMVCGREDYKLDSLPPEIVVVLDRSKTMGFPIVGNTSTRWNVVIESLDQVIQRTDANILWGLKVFPSQSGCGITPQLDVDVALKNHAAINAATKKITPNQGASGTPMQAALRRATALLAARKTANPKYLLLATDGLPACGDNQPMAEDRAGTVAAIADARTAGIKTFVVGIATHDEGALAEQVLGMMAEAGGEARPAPPRFFPVNDRADLLKTLDLITARVASCVFPLGKEPPSPNDVHVKVDGRKVEKDATNGWSLDPAGKTLLLNGAACEALREGNLRRTQEVEIIFGCPGLIIE